MLKLQLDCGCILSGILGVVVAVEITFRVMRLGLELALMLGIGVAIMLKM